MLCEISQTEKDFTCMWNIKNEQSKTNQINDQTKQK